MKIIATTDKDFEQQLGRITNRMEEQERTQPAAIREKTIEIFGKPLTPAEVVRKIVADVRKKGDAAVLKYARRIEGSRFKSAADFRVPDDEIEAAPRRIDPALYAAIRKAVANVRRYQEHILTREPEPIETGGRKLWARYRPVDVAGVYVPGGLAPYPSSLIMCAVPAIVAGVKRVFLCTPPRNDAVVLAAAEACGISEIYRVGGVQAIAAMAFGTATVPRADKIAGPGNYLVMLAKKEIFGYADIDLFAGPSEILVLADDSADIAYVAADMLSQAEHGSRACAILVTTSRRLARKVQQQIRKQLDALPNPAAAEESMKLYGAAIIARTAGECVSLANRIAPEHLEILLAEPEQYVDRIENAGAIFIGPHTPEPVGDYIAGSSHILPTAGTARFFSGLSANTFLKRTSIIRYTKEALAEDTPAIAAIARAESFEAHARSAEIRQTRKT